MLNETAALVWRLIENGDGIASIAAAVASEYDVDPESAAEDVRALVARLLEENLIRAAERGRLLFMFSSGSIGNPRTFVVELPPIHPGGTKCFAPQRFVSASRF